MSDAARVVDGVGKAHRARGVVSDAVGSAVGNGGSRRPLDVDFGFGLLSCVPHSGGAVAIVADGGLAVDHHHREAPSAAGGVDRNGRAPARPAGVRRAHVFGGGPVVADGRVAVHRRQRGEAAPGSRVHRHRRVTPTGCVVPPVSSGPHIHQLLVKAVVVADGRVAVHHRQGGVCVPERPGSHGDRGIPRTSVDVRAQRVIHATV